MHLQMCGGTDPLQRIRIESGVNTPERLEVDSVMSSENVSPGCAMSLLAMPQPSALARQVASKVIKHARDIKCPNEHDMWCPDCRLFPKLPVTGQCGHTRCYTCIEKNGACPCGSPAPDTLHFNILIQDLMAKMRPREKFKPATSCSALTSIQDQLQTPSTSTGRCQESMPGPERFRRQCRFHSSAGPGVTKIVAQCRQPVAPQARYKYARDLLASGRYREAAPHLAHVAASSEPVARSAKLLLPQAISVLSESRDPRCITRELYRTVREQSTTAWLKPSDLECIICYQVLRRPVTTPCGHTFCRDCIEHFLIYNKRCPLCSRPLDNFCVFETADTSFVCAALAAIDSLLPPASPLESEFITIFVCFVAYPEMPYPLLMFDPRYWEIIRRIMETGSRKFGMVAFETNGTCSNFGTIVEIRDCVHYEDGCSILSTVGVSRFRIIEKAFQDGCNMARIEELTDIIPTAHLFIWELKLLAQQISIRAMVWLSTLDRGLLCDIKSAFGEFPHFEEEGDWWENPNGPAWLWWLVAILPLKPEIQILILSMRHLMKRMTVVSRMLELLHQVAMTPPYDRGMLPINICKEVHLIYHTSRERREN